jgi:hypothetical protein
MDWEELSRAAAASQTGSRSRAPTSERVAKYNKNFADRREGDVDAQLRTTTWERVTRKKTRDDTLATIRERLLDLPARGLACRKCKAPAAVSAEERMVTVYERDFAKAVSLPVWYMCTSTTCGARELINPIEVDYFPASPIHQVVGIASTIGFIHGSGGSEPCLCVCCQSQPSCFTCKQLSCGTKCRWCGYRGRC